MQTMILLLLCGNGPVSLFGYLFMLFVIKVMD